MGKNRTRFQEPDMAPLRQVLEGRAETAARTGACHDTTIRRAKSRRHTSDHVEPQMRQGVALSAAHVAAEDGRIWWLERCGASAACSGMLEEPDGRLDTPLHRCARCGQADACRTLLRLGADPAARNMWRLWPEDLAKNEGHAEIAALLKGIRLRKGSGAAASREFVRKGSGAADSNELVRIGSGAAASSEFVRKGSAAAASIELLANSAWRAVVRHPDGLGALAEPSAHVPFNGIFPSDSLRHAINHAAGSDVLPRLLQAKAETREVPPEGAPEDGAAPAVEPALELVRAALAGTGFELEAAAAPAVSVGAGGDGWAPRGDGAEVCGLLAFEAPGCVSPDARGHWVALRVGVRPGPLPADAPVAGAASAAREDVPQLPAEQLVEPIRGPTPLALPCGAEEEIAGNMPAAAAPETPPRLGEVAGGPGHEEEGEEEEARFLRLDSVRGPFLLTGKELDVLAKRYKVWRLLRLASASGPAADQ